MKQFRTAQYSLRIAYVHCKTVLNLLEGIYLRLLKIVVYIHDVRNVKQIKSNFVQEKHAVSRCVAVTKV